MREKMSTTNDNRATSLLGMLAAALAVVAIAAAITGMVREIGSLGLIAAAIAAVLAAAVVWLNGMNSALGDRVAEQDLELAKMGSASALADRVASEIAGPPPAADETPAAAETAEPTTIRTPAGDLTGLDIDPSIFNPEDKEVVEDLILAAIKDAQTKAKDKSEEEMKKITEELGLPADMKLPF